MSEETVTCRVDGCDRPVVEIFRGKQGVACAKHSLEALATFFETEWEGDSIEDIHRGEQLGAWLRGVPQAKEDTE